MTWQLLIGLYLVLGTASYLWRRQLGKAFAHANRLVNAFFFLVVLYPMGLVAALFTAPDLAIGWWSLLLLFAGGAIFPMSNILLYRANRDIDAGLLTMISNLVPVVSITAGWFLLNETLNGRQLLGAAIILLAALIVTVPMLRQHMVHSARALIFSLVAVVLIGLGFVFERYMLIRVDFGAYLVVGWGLQTFWAVVFAWPERKSLRVLRDAKIRLPLLGFSVSSSLRGLCFVGALSLSGNVSLVVASASFLIVLVVLSAYFILKETEWLWLKLGTGALGVAGLLLLQLG